jgi:signal transduction histidine kinase/HAMP domain-containing protein
MMKLRIKSKLSLGLSFLFAVVVLTGTIGLYAINRLAGETKNILKANYESVVYAKNMQIDLDNFASNSPAYINDFEKNLEAQEKNITEQGELDATSSLRDLFEKFRQKDSAISLIPLIRNKIYLVSELNMNAIVRKSNETQVTANKAKLYLEILVTICILLSFSFLLNFPGYIANPIKELAEGIKQVANKNYSQRINIDKNDEFGELAVAFNSMAKQLDNYENSNLAKIIFERKRIETIINGMKDPIIGLDENMKILFVNTMAIKILGIKESDLLGKYAPDVALNNDLLRNLIVIGNSNTAPLKIYADAKESYFSKEILKIAVEDKAIGSVILLRNITQFKELDLAKTNFIATISHELKTPIASIKMSLKLLEDNRIGQLNNEQTKLIGNIKEDSQRLLSITGELLDLAQVESGKITLEKQPVEARSIMEYANNALKVQAEQKHITIKLNCPEGLPKVNCDLEKTAWVMVNFLSNAIRYSSENSEIITEVKNTPEGLVFSTRDYGKGIDPKYQSRIFDRFNKIPNEEVGKSGTGLGLAISKEFIESQNGVIGVESTVGKGSRFYFMLPVE